jgi:hypothetical protein
MVARGEAQRSRRELSRSSRETQQRSKYRAEEPRRGVQAVGRHSTTQRIHLCTVHGHWQEMRSCGGGHSTENCRLRHRGSRRLLGQILQRRGLRDMVQDVVVG